jgi:hypothetical protein
LNILIFIFYLLLCCWLVNKLGFVKKLQLPVWVVLGLFLLKVAAGLAYGWFYTKMPDYLTQADTWRMFTDSLQEKEVLLHKPWQFFLDIFRDPYAKGSSDLFAGQNSYWNDLKSNVLIKLMAVMNVFTFSNYYANVILYSFITFIGPAAFANVFLQAYPNNKKTIIVGSFLIPSFLFWCSGVHKDGLIFMLLALLIYHFYQSLAEKKFTGKRIFWMALCWFLIFPLRNYVALATLPALVAWWWAAKNPAHSWRRFAIVYALSGIAFFGLPFLNKSLNFPQVLVNKQAEFFQLKGTSLIAKDTLQDNALSYAKLLPQSINHAFLRPYITEAKKPTYVPAALEVIGSLGLVLLFLFCRKKFNAAQPLIPALLFLSISLLLLVGYTIPFLAAIVRYRSIYLPFLLLPLLIHVDWARVRGVLGNRR